MMIALSQYLTLSQDITDIELTGPSEITIIVKSDADVKNISKKVNSLTAQLDQSGCNLSFIYVYDNGRIIEIWTNFLLYL